MNEIRSKQEARIVKKKGVRNKNRMMICIGIDVHKKKCVATIKRDSREIVEQTSYLL